MKKEDAISFLLFCYFGDLSDPILAAIDRAYRDMQAHTISGDNETIIFPRRRVVTQYMHDRILHLPEYAGNYDDWHEKTIEEMKGISEKHGELSYGLLQKWLNMTIKYMCTLKLLGVDSIDDYFIKKESIKSFHAPLDSYVLQEIEMQSPTWSNINSYNAYIDRKNQIEFEKEYKEWPEYAKKAQFTKKGKIKKSERGTYKRYIQEKPYDFNRK